jgi:hypothetical protein
MMKFLLTVLTIRFLVEMVSNKKNSTDTNDPDLRSGKTFHPAEFALR